jgi:FkbM family methyltransferase
MSGEREPMISYAQNGEDVLLARLFGRQRDGFYLDVGANDPTDFSLTKHFYDRGWHGVNVEPVPDAYARLRAERPRDTNLNLGVAARRGDRSFYEVVGQSVLSTFSAEQAALYRAEGRPVVERPVHVLSLAEVCAAHVQRPIDFLSIDVEGLEREVLAGGDWERWRPRVVVVEATRPNTTLPAHQEWEPLLLEAGYLFAYFDGLNRFYVRGEEPALLEGFRVPVNVCDNYVYYPYHIKMEALRERAEDAERHLRASHAEVTATHAALTEARGVLDALVEQVKQHRGWLHETKARLAGADSELTAAKRQLAELRRQLDAALRQHRGACGEVERLSQELRDEQARRAQTEQALAVRFAHGVKTVLSGPARLKRLLRPRAACPSLPGRPAGGTIACGGAALLPP